MSMLSLVEFLAVFLLGACVGMFATAILAAGARADEAADRAIASRQGVAK